MGDQETVNFSIRQVCAKCGSSAVGMFQRSELLPPEGYGCRECGCTEIKTGYFINGEPVEKELFETRVTEEREKNRTLIGHDERDVDDDLLH